MIARRVLGAVAALAVFALPLYGSPFAVALGLACLMYAALAVSWSIFSGPTRTLSLATSAFFGLGAYCTAFALGSLPWPVIIFLGGGVAAAFAALIGLAVLRLRGAYFAVLTFGLGEVVRHTVTYVEKSQSGTVGRVLTDTPPRGHGLRHRRRAGGAGGAGLSRWSRAAISASRCAGSATTRSAPRRWACTPGAPSWRRSV